ncbi:MAG: TolC family protein [Candidatus Hydrogenedentes bacterium]|nr:TolC family protein [Candidatus Hydrogenedentota bacterium]
MRRYLPLATLVLALAATARPAAAAAEAARECDAADVTLPAVLDLEAAQAIALADYPSLQAAEARVRQARAVVMEARSAWFPQVDLTGSAAKTWLSERDYRAARDAASSPYWDAFYGSASQGVMAQTQARCQYFGSILSSLITGGAPAVPSGLATPPEFFSGMAQGLLETARPAVAARRKIDDSVEDFRLSLTASWVVFSGFERKFAHAQARFGLQETEMALLEAKRLLLAAVAQAFYSAQLARENIAIAQADEAFNARQLKEAKARRRVGAGSLSDELNFEVRVNSARASLIAAERDYRSALAGLAELLALPDSVDPADLALAELPAEASGQLEPPDPVAALHYAKVHRPDLIQAGYAVDRSRAGVGLSRAAFYPTVVASASKDAARSNDYDFGDDDFATTIGVHVSYNLFAGGRDVARVRQAKAARVEAERGCEQVALGVTSAVRTAVADLEAAQQSLALERINAGNVADNRDLVEKEYQAGEASLVRLNEAQRDLIAAQGSLAYARVSLLLAWHNLRTETAETVEIWAEDE